MNVLQQLESLIQQAIKENNRALAGLLSAVKAAHEEHSEIELLIYLIPFIEMKINQTLN